MTKKDVLREFEKLDAVDSAKAIALYDAGFTSTKKLKDATIGSLTKLDGISRRVAKSIVYQLNPEKKEKLKRKAKKAAVDKKEMAETEEVVVRKKPKRPELSGAKIKPALTEAIENALALRRHIKVAKPKARRQEWFRYRRLGENWRRARGIHSKMRRNLKYRPKMPAIGYSSPRAVRGLHPSGFKEVHVSNPRDLEMIDPKREAARIAHSVGTKKRIAIAEKAEELNIRLLN